eukprot:SAG31_NODE_45941_length_256_cov_1.312102_1_plen_35_part_01
MRHRLAHHGHRRIAIVCDLDCDLDWNRWHGPFRML